MRAKTYNVGELVLCLSEKKKNKLKPKWEGPFIIDQVLTVERTVCGMHRIIDSSQTHGTQSDYEDSMPCAGLYVHLLTSMNFLHIYFFLSFFLSFLFKTLKGYTCVLVT